MCVVQCDGCGGEMSSCRGSLWHLRLRRALSLFDGFKACFFFLTIVFFFFFFPLLSCEFLWQRGRGRCRGGAHLTFVGHHSSRTLQQVHKRAPNSFLPCPWPPLVRCDVCRLFSTPQLFSQQSSVAAGHQFVDKRLISQ